MKKCKYCKNDLPRNSPERRKYCSDNCRKAANAEKNKESRKETNRKYYEKRKLR